MGSVSRRLALPLLLLAGLAAPAAAERGAGMVIKVSGNTEPAMIAYGEVPANMPVAVLDNGRVTVVHYRSCDTITVAGGTFVLTGDGLEMRSGTVESRTKRPCPREHRLAGDAKTSGAAILSRAGRASRMPPRPTLVIAGNRADRVRAAEIRGEDAERHALGVGGRELRWPAGDPPLTPGRRYVLRLSIEGDEAGFELPFTAVEVEGGGESATFDIVRVD